MFTYEHIYLPKVVKSLYCIDKKEAELIKFLVIGIVLMIITSLIDYKVYCKKFKFFPIRPVVILYLLCLGLHLYVFFAGYSINGSSRWIQLDICKLTGIGLY